MRLFSTIVLVAAFVAALTYLPLVLTRLSYRIYPRSVEALLWSVLGHACAWPMEGIYRVTEWADDRAQRRGWFRLARWCGAVGQRFCPDQFHLTAIVLGHVCWPCMEGAAGWWDYEVDCGGHRCRTCEQCIHERGGRHLASA